MKKNLNLLRNCPPENGFVVFNGGTLKSGRELVSALETMDEWTFRYHVNTDNNKNDFAAWIRDVFHDNSLADKLQDTMDKGAYIQHIKDRLSELLSRARKKKSK